MEIRCIKGMYRLKLVSCENNSGFKGLKQDMEEGGTREGKRSGGWEKRNKKRRNGKRINLLGWHVTELLTKSCMVAYEW